MLEHASLVANGVWDIPVAFALREQYTAYFFTRQPLPLTFFAQLPPLLLGQFFGIHRRKKRTLPIQNQTGSPYLVCGDGILASMFAVIELFICGFDKFIELIRLCDFTDMQADGDGEFQFWGRDQFDLFDSFD